MPESNTEKILEVKTTRIEKIMFSTEGLEFTYTEGDDALEVGVVHGDPVLNTDEVLELAEYLQGLAERMKGQPKPPQGDE